MKNKIKTYFYKIATDRRTDIASCILKFILLILSYIYCIGLKMIIFCYRRNIFRQFKSVTKVISVGNITVGGTGKTPVEEYLIKHFFKSKKAVLLSRGYSNDELNLLTFNLSGIKILAGKNRVKLLKRASKYFKPEIIILDDAFQHWRISRDIDIVLIDAFNPFGNGKLLPRGILREPLEHLKRADIFFITKAYLGRHNLSYIRDVLRGIKSEAPIIESEHKPLYLYEPINDRRRDLFEIKDKKVLAFCGIGTSQSFKGTLERTGAKIISFREFIDHYQYKEEDIDNIIQDAERKKVQALITTEKDWMRLDSEMISKISQTCKLYILKIEINILSGEEKLVEYISGLFNC